MKNYHCYTDKGETKVSREPPKAKVDNHRTIKANSETIARMTFETDLKLNKIKQND